MNHFTISDIENLTRIKAHTLRVWEKRYHLITPKRTLSGHRFYDGEDLKTMLRIAWLYDNGHKISQIAQFSHDEMRVRALGFDIKEVAPEHYLNMLMEASIDLNTFLFKKAMQDASDQLGFETMILKIAFPFLKKIGLLWLTGHVIPAQEHFASTLITQRILLETDKLPPVNPMADGRIIALFTPPGEHHEVPLLYVKYLLRKKSVQTVYFGAGIATDTLTTYCQYKKVDQLYFHLITNLTRIDLFTYLRTLGEQLPGKKIFFSGIRPEIEKKLPEGIHYLGSNEAILEFIDRM